MEEDAPFETRVAEAFMIYYYSFGFSANWDDEVKENMYRIAQEIRKRATFILAPENVPDNFK